MALVTNSFVGIGDDTPTKFYIADTLSDLPSATTVVLNSLALVKYDGNYIATGSPATWTLISQRAVYLRKTSNETISSTTYDGAANITGLSWTPTADTDYGLEFTIPFTISDTSNGVGFGIHVSSGTTVNYVAGTVTIPTSLSARTASDFTAINTGTATTSVASTTDVYVAKMKGVVSIGSLGGGPTIQIRAIKAGAGVGNPTIKKGAWGFYY